jgi:hypothetical protein
LIGVYRIAPQAGDMSEQDATVGHKRVGGTPPIMRKSVGARMSRRGDLTRGALPVRTGRERYRPPRYTTKTKRTRTIESAKTKHLSTVNQVYSHQSS